MTDANVPPPMEDWYGNLSSRSDGRRLIVEATWYSADWLILLETTGQPVCPPNIEFL